MGEADRHPVAATLARLDARDEYVRFVHGDPGGDGWLLLDDLLAGPVLATMVQALLDGEARGAGDVAASFSAGWLADAVAVPPAAALRAERRAWPLHPGGIALHRDPGGWPDGVAVLGDRFWCLPDDPDAGHPDAEVLATHAALVERWAAEVAAVVEPLYADLRRRLPFGLAGMWGTLADAVAGHAVREVDDAGGDVDAAWAEVGELLDALAGRVPRLRTRPRLHPFAHGGTTRHATVRGTCCLWYKAYDGAADPAGEGYCTTCPLRDDDVRTQRLTAWLDGRAAATTA